MKYILRLTFILLFFSSGCTKYLDAVPDKSLTVPNTVADYQALLENDIMVFNAPALGEISADDLYLPDDLWNTQSVFIRETYRWSKDLRENNTSINWNNAYQKIYYANIVLEGVGKLRNTQTSADVDFITGWALFCRANAFYDLQEVFGRPYRPASSNTDLSIPLRLNTALREKSTRSTVAVTFQQIINDLEQAIKLLPAQVSSSNRGRPSKAAAYALLSRVYLTMQNYGKALENANNSLSLYNKLVDYNTLNTTSKAPFSPLIDEVMYNAIQLNYSGRYWQVPSDFYQSYVSDDLRKVLFFTVDPIAGSIVFKGFYSAVSAGFSGVTVDEMYLVKAECEARAGNNDQALLALNTVLVKRFKTGKYVPYTTGAVMDVLALVLSEKRKECLFRNLRWSDLRRLNQDTRFAKTLIRVVEGITYSLPPNDLRYTLPIPEDEIRSTGIEQNIR